MVSIVSLPHGSDLPCFSQSAISLHNQHRRQHHDRHCQGDHSCQQQGDIYRSSSGSGSAIILSALVIAITIFGVAVMGFFHLDNKMTDGFARVDANFDALSARMDSKFDYLNVRMDGLYKLVDPRK